VTTSVDMAALQYPIGKRAPRTAYSSESRSVVIGDIAALPAKVRQAVAGLTDIQLDTPYRPDGWTVRQVVHHLADAHVILYTRAKIALTEDNPPVKIWEEIPWAELPDAPSPSSVRKLLDIMIDRRLLAREYDGPRFVYFPAATPEDASRSALKQLVRTFFDNSPGSAAAALLGMDAEPISDEEYKRLSALLKRRREGGTR